MAKHDRIYLGSSKRFTHIFIYKHHSTEQRTYQATYINDGKVVAKLFSNEDEAADWVREGLMNVKLKRIENRVKNFRNKLMAELQKEGDVIAKKK